MKAIQFPVHCPQFMSEIRIAFRSYTAKDA
jgi:hypothetical protein